MSKFFPALVGLVLLVACGVVHGLWTDRWDLSNEPKISADRLAGVPKVLGDWTVKNEWPLPEQDQAIGKIVGYIDRLYVNQRTGQALTVLCVCGRPGPIGQHPPTVCFGGAGFELAKDARRESFPSEGFSQESQFWVGEFKKDTGVPQMERVYWSWSGDGNWIAAASPRLQFSRFPALYKLYVIHRMSRPDESGKEDPTPEFMKLLLPEMQKTLFARP